MNDDDDDEEEKGRNTTTTTTKKIHIRNFIFLCVLFHLFDPDDDEEAEHKFVFFYDHFWTVYIC